MRSLKHLNSRFRENRLWRSHGKTPEFFSAALLLLLLLLGYYYYYYLMLEGTPLSWRKKVHMLYRCGTSASCDNLRKLSHHHPHSRLMHGIKNPALVLIRANTRLNHSLIYVSISAEHWLHYTPCCIFISFQNLWIYLSVFHFKLFSSLSKTQ